MRSVYVEWSLWVKSSGCRLLFYLTDSRMSQKGEVPNMVISGAELWLRAERPHPLNVQAFNLQGSANQKIKERMVPQDAMSLRYFFLHTTLNHTKSISKVPCLVCTGSFILWLDEASVHIFSDWKWRASSACTKTQHKDKCESSEATRVLGQKTELVFGFSWPHLWMHPLQKFITQGNSLKYIKL